jgi:glucose-6-phosphate 1-dehydrogenase
VTIHFKRLSHNIFRECCRKLPANRPITRLQPDEGVAVEALYELPGLGKGMRLPRTLLDFSFSQAFKGERITRRR